MENVEENEEKFKKGRKEVKNVRGNSTAKDCFFFFLLVTFRKPLKVFSTLLEKRIGFI